MHFAALNLYTFTALFSYMFIAVSVVIIRAVVADAAAVVIVEAGRIPGAVMVAGAKEVCIWT